MSQLNGVPAAYVILDRSEDPPVWRLLTETDAKPARLDDLGQITVEEHANVIAWATRAVFAVVSLRPLPSPIVYSVREVNDA